MVKISSGCFYISSCKHKIKGSNVEFVQDARKEDKQLFSKSGK